MAQRPRTKTAPAKRPRARLALDLAGGDVPSEFRIFAFGVNPSEKGDFLFDQTSADSVMDEYRAHGKPMLLDFNHGTTLLDPTPEQGIAAGEFVPEVRADGLWATQIKWTERARSMLQAREYRLYSPYFEHDQQTGRVLRLINVALTNLPALDHIEPLVAASATDGGSPMEYEKLYNELKAQHETLQAEIKALRAKLSKYEDEDKDKMSAVALRATVLQLVGKTNEAEAVGALQALSAARTRLADIEKQLETERTVRLSADFSTTLDKAVTDGKVPPAQRPYWEGIAKEDGFEKATARLRGFAETAVALTRNDPVKQPEGNAHTMSAGQRAMAANLGWSPEKMAAFEKSQSGGATT